MTSASFLSLVVLGIAMGTSEAVGYVDEQGRITGWLNELAFVPVDASPNALEDEWSHDNGCCGKHDSNDGEQDVCHNVVPQKEEIKNCSYDSKLGHHHGTCRKSAP